MCLAGEWEEPSFNVTLSRACSALPVSASMCVRYNKRRAFIVDENFIHKLSERRRAVNEPLHEFARGMNFIPTTCHPLTHVRVQVWKGVAETPRNWVSRVVWRQYVPWQSRVLSWSKSLIRCLGNKSISFLDGNHFASLDGWQAWTNFSGNKKLSFMLTGKRSENYLMKHKRICSLLTMRLVCLFYVESSSKSLNVHDDFNLFINGDCTQMMLHISLNV